jgi:hypothetical protein
MKTIILVAGLFFCHTFIGMTQCVQSNRVVFIWFIA